MLPVYLFKIESAMFPLCKTKNEYQILSPVRHSVDSHIMQYSLQGFSNVCDFGFPLKQNRFRCLY